MKLCPLIASLTQVHFYPFKVLTNVTYSTSSSKDELNFQKPLPCSILLTSISIPIGEWSPCIQNYLHISSLSMNVRAY